MAFALTTVIDLHVLHGSMQPAAPWRTVVFSSVLVILYASFIASRSPVTYYAYAFFPLFFWESVYARRSSLAEGRKVLFGHITSGTDLLSFLFNASVYIGVIESLVCRRSWFE